MCKVAFELEQDEHGYPPVSVETLWAYQVEPELYRLDNIPLYARGVSSEDVVQTRQEFGRNIFDKVLLSSGNSVFRIYVSDVTDIPTARASFKHLGCESEMSDIPKLFAVEIPGNVPFGPIASLLVEGLDSDRWEYEEACLRHVAPEIYLQRKEPDSKAVS